MLEVHLEHLLVVFLKYSIKHVREHELLNQLLLLVGGFLFLQRLKLFLYVFLGSLNEQVPIAFFLIILALMGCKKVV
jgi:hypothetical protein